MSVNFLSRKLLNFGRLDEADLSLLDAIVSKTRTVQPYVDLISEGDKPGDVHLVLRGFACRYKILQDGRRQIMAYLVPGDLCDLHVYLLDHMDHSIARWPSARWWMSAARPSSNCWTVRQSPERC